MNWTSQLTGQPANYRPILSTITPADGECLQAIYDALNDHATIAGTTLLDYVAGGICVDFRGKRRVNPASVSTLKAVGVILTNDNVHIGLTPLGYGFMQTMLNN